VVDKDRQIRELSARLCKMEAEIFELKNQSSGGSIRAPQLSVSTQMHHPILAAVNGATDIPSPRYGSLAVSAGASVNASQSGASAAMRGGSPLRGFFSVAAPPVTGALAPPGAAGGTASPLRLWPDSNQVLVTTRTASPMRLPPDSSQVFLGASFKGPVLSSMQIPSPLASPLASPLRMRPGETVQLVRAASPVAFRVPMMPPTATIPNGNIDRKNRWLTIESQPEGRYAPASPRPGPRRRRLA